MAGLFKRVIKKECNRYELVYHRDQQFEDIHRPVFVNMTRRGALPEEASIHTAEMTSMRELQKREEME